MLTRTCFLYLLASLFQLPLYAATFTVNSVADSLDSIPGDGICSDVSGNCTLRAAIQETNALAGADIIMLPAGTYNLAIAGVGEELAASGDLDINDSLTINGAGAQVSFINGQAIDRVFDIGPSIAAITVTFNNMTVTNGNVAGNGGLIRNAGTFMLTESVLENGQAALGGGLHTIGNLTVSRSLFHANTSSSDGGGFFQGGGTTNITNTTFSANTATGNGGGLFLATAVSTTLGFNTIAFNSASLNGGGGLFNAGNLALNSTIVSDNTSENCANSGGVITSDGSSLDSGNTCGLTMGVDLVNTTPSLGLLSDNGGQTATHALPAGSAAIDRGAITCPGVDQRNVVRPIDGDNSMTAECDIGAYEWTPAIDLEVTNAHDKDCVKKGRDVTYRIGVTNIGSGDASNVVLTDTLPGSTTFVSVDVGCTYSSGLVTCNIGNLAAGSGQNFTVVVNAPVTDYLTNTVNVTAAEQDSNLSNNTAEEKTRINCTACFIATAAYGSPWHEGVLSLRRFRDQYLFQSKMGRILVLTYYKYSPAIAQKIRDSEMLRMVTRASLAPFVLVSKLITSTKEE